MSPNGFFGPLFGSRPIGTLLNGKGGAQDLVGALTQFKLAGDQGLESAKEIYRTMLSAGARGPVELAAASAPRVPEDAHRIGILI